MNLDLIKEYIENKEFFWSDKDQEAFRQLYYKLFYESFGQSRKCWDIAINKVYKQILYRK